MKSMKGSHIVPGAQTTTNEYRKGVFLHMPALGRLLDELESGTVPNWFAVMEALSEAVEYVTMRNTGSAQKEAFNSTCNGRCCTNC